PRGHRRPRRVARRPAYDQAASRRRDLHLCRHGQVECSARKKPLLPSTARTWAALVNLIVMKTLKFIAVVAASVVMPAMVHATTITNTRPEIAQMAGSWEVDSVQISPLANAQVSAT